MKKPRIYIAGKVTGENRLTCAVKFGNAASYLLGYKFLPINPIHVVNDWSCPWQKAMRICIAELMKADAVFVLKDYHKSKGAMLEVDIAKNINIPVFEDYEELCKHFGQLPKHLCTHPDTRIVNIGGACGCETTIQRCTWCGADVTEPKTEC